MYKNISKKKFIIVTSNITLINLSYIEQNIK